MVPNPMGLYRARVAVSDASTLRTSDWDNPICRAIKDGLMPALNAARTALICPTWQRDRHLLLDESVPKRSLITACVEEAKPSH